MHDADRGEIPEQILFERLGEIAGRSSDQVRQEWNTYVRIDPDVVALVQEVRAHSRVALLTNCPSPFFRAIIERHDLVGLFDVIVVSSEVGVAKPDARAYQRVLEQLPTAAGECLMIDDNPANVEGAQAVGMQALLFTSAAACRDTLRSCGLVS